MTRPAKLYYLHLKDWKPLLNLFPKDKNRLLEYEVTIVQQSSNVCCIISLTDDIDKILEDYGCELSNENDSNKTLIFDQPLVVLFGEKSNLIYLKSM